MYHYFCDQYRIGNMFSISEATMQSLSDLQTLQTAGVGVVYRYFPWAVPSHRTLKEPDTGGVVARTCQKVRME